MNPLNDTTEQKIREYAKNYHMSYENAKIRVLIFEKLAEAMHEASLCPSCKQHSLYMEPSEEEYSSQAWIVCENEECPYSSDVSPEFEMLSHTYDFDVVAAVAYDVKKNVDGFVQQMGTSWDEFVQQSNKDLLHSDGWRIGYHIQ